MKLTVSKDVLTLVQELRQEFALQPTLQLQSSSALRNLLLELEKALPPSGVKIDEEHDLYVIEDSEGVSCRGFENVAAETAAMAFFTERMDLLPAVTSYGTIPGYEANITARHELQKFLAAHRIKRCPLELTPELIGKEGYRVDVTDDQGEHRRFNVALSTGWMPCHLEMASTASSGGGAVMGPIRTVDVIRAESRSTLDPREFGAPDMTILREKVKQVQAQAAEYAAGCRRIYATRKAGEQTAEVDERE